MCCHLMNGITSLENDVMEKTHPLAQHNDHSVLLLLHSSCQIHIPSTMRLCNSRIPEECLVCYQTSQRNWVIIKMLYRYLWRYLLGWHRSRLGFVTPSIGEVSLGPLGNTHHYKCRWETTPMGSLESLLRLRDAGIVRRAGLADSTKGIYPGSGRKDA